MLKRLTSYLHARLAFSGFEPASDHDAAMMARTGFYLYSAGAVIGLAVLTVPAQHRDSESMLVIAFCALSLGWLELIAFDRLPLWAFQALTACGTLLTSAAVYKAGSTAEIYRLLYVWVIFYAAYFFSLRALIVQLGLIVAASAFIVWLADGDQFAWATWFLRQATFVVAGGLVYVLRRRWAGLLRTERDRVVKLRELDKLKDEFIATASHELRTPVTSLYGAAQTLSMVELDPAMRKRLIDIIGSEAARLSARMDAILRVDQIGTGQAPATLASCNLNALAEEAVTAAKLGWTREDITFELQLVSPAPIVSADGGHLREVLDNLISNAGKYSPRGGTITVSTQTDGTSATLSVADTGIGVPAGEEEAVFDKFYRADPQMTHGIGGTGLGLYISRQLIEGMFGRIRLERQPVGTKVTLQLPLVKGES